MKLTERHLESRILERDTEPDMVLLAEMPRCPYPIQRAIHGPYRPRKPTLKQRFWAWVDRHLVDPRLYD